MTNWTEYTPHRHSWLLGTGEVVETPPLESTPHRRRFRLRDDPDVRMWKNELDQTVLDSVRKLAEIDGTFIICPLGAETDLYRSFREFTAINIGDARTGEPPSLTGDYVRAWWHFRSDTKPIHMVVVAELRNVSANHSTFSLKVATNRIYASQNDLVPSDSENAPALTTTILPQGGSHQFVEVNGRFHSKEIEDQLNWLSDNMPDWYEAIDGIESVYSHEAASRRKSIEQMLKACAIFDDLDELELPIAPIQSMETCSLAKTNVNQEFITDLEDFCDGSPVAVDLVHHFEEIRRIMKIRGIVVEDVSIDQVVDALSGNTRVLDVHLDDGTRDHEHAITLNLLNGIAHVSCSVKSNLKNDESAQQEWEVALLKAELQGTKDEFLSFCAERSAKGLAAEIRERLSDII